MKPDSRHNKCGIYCIRNLQDDKIYIGKSKNIYKRIHQHIYDLKNNRKDSNTYLQRAYKKYGFENFEYFVLEFLPLDEVIVSKRELYWIKELQSTNRKTGYNLRTDSDSRMITHQETSDKISKRLKKEWAEGVRSKHSEKLTKSWKENPERRLSQSLTMTQIKTKYKYEIYEDNTLIHSCNYQKLKELNLHSCLSTFHRKKINTVTFKKYVIKRLILDDIVQSLSKDEGEL